MRKHEGVPRAALQTPARTNRRRSRPWHRRPPRAPPLSCCRPWARDAGPPRPAPIAFGFQVVLGTLVNAILNDPGPLSLRSKEMDVRLAGCLLLLLQAEIDQPTPR